MAYDYDNAPTDPTHGGKMTAEQAAHRIAQLERALFAMFDAYEGVYDMKGPPLRQSDAAKHAEGLARDALAHILIGKAS
jgi:hypothetical protein